MEQIDTTRFGQIEVEAADIVSFPSGVLGFPETKRYVLIEHQPDSPYRWMQSADEAHLAFLVTDPGNFVPDYAPEMPAKDAEALKLNEDTPRLVYTIVTIPSGNPREMTLNLAGPVVINAADRIGRQIVLEDSAYPVRHRAFGPEKEGAAA